jgi:hypothetical protein
MSITCVYINILRRPLCPTFPMVLNNTNLCTCVPCLDRSIKILAFLFWSLPLVRRCTQARRVAFIPEYFSLSETSANCYQHTLRNNPDERRPHVSLRHTRNQAIYKDTTPLEVVFCLLARKPLVGQGLTVEASRSHSRHTTMGRSPLDK